MDRDEIARRIAELESEHREALYYLCEMRRQRAGPVATAVYEKIDSEARDALEAQGLVWTDVPLMAAARHDVYEYWLEKIYKPVAAPHRTAPAAGASARPQ
jgi:hypothetical protein